jgi:hypothetical protein
MARPIIAVSMLLVLMVWMLCRSGMIRLTSRAANSYDGRRVMHLCFTGCTERYALDASFILCHLRGSSVTIELMMSAPG